MKRSGMKTAIKEIVSEMTVKPISLAPSESSLHRGFALFDVADDVLDHHDGIVDHEAGADRQRHQGEIVEAEAAEPHDAEESRSRQRQRDAGDQSRAQRAQEQQHHQDDKPDAQNQRELHVVDRGADSAGAVADHGEQTPAGMAR